jgi:hypothetical protein
MPPLRMSPAPTSCLRASTSIKHNLIDLAVVEQLAGREIGLVLLGL